jgi:hypothetical protein
MGLRRQQARMLVKARMVKPQGWQPRFGASLGKSPGGFPRRCKPRRWPGGGGVEGSGRGLTCDDGSPGLLYAHCGRSYRFLKPGWVRRRRGSLGGKEPRRNKHRGLVAREKTCRRNKHRGLVAREETCRRKTWVVKRRWQQLGLK